MARQRASIGNAASQAGQEDENLGCIGEPEGVIREFGQRVAYYMIDENHVYRKAATEVYARITHRDIRPVAMLRSVAIGPLGNQLPLAPAGLSKHLFPSQYNDIPSPVTIDRFFTVT